MTAPVVIADEVTAAGFRLAGAHVRVPEVGGELTTLERARREAELVLITAELAARIAPSALRQALAARVPLLLIIPDIRGNAAPPDVAEALRTALGMEE